LRPSRKIGRPLTRLAENRGKKESRRAVCAEFEKTSRDDIRTCPGMGTIVNLKADAELIQKETSLREK